MAKHKWHGGLLAGIAGVAISGCLPQAQQQASSAEAQTPANVAPSIAGAPQLIAAAGQTWQFQPTASDANGDSLTFSASGLPAWLTLQPSTGLLSGTPTVANVGTTSSIVVTVSDGTTSTALPAFSITVSPSAGNGTASLSWSPPTEYTDGTILPASELAAFRIYQGTSAGALSRVAEVDYATSAFTITSLPVGTYYFAITAVTVSGSESGLSSIGSKTIL